MKKKRWNHDGVVVVMGLVILSAGLGIGALMGSAYEQRHHAESPHKAVWVEFENIQHAADSVARLGGRDRGLSVCVGKGYVEDNPKLWVPRGVNVTGDLRECQFQPRPAPVAMMTMNGDSTVSHLMFESGETTGISIRSNIFSN